MLGTRHGRGAVGVTGRLVALVMIPVTVMCGLALSRVTTLRATAGGALAIDRGVVQLSALVELHASLAAQQAVEEFFVRIDELGTTPASGDTFLGVDLDAGIGPARARVAHALGVLGASSPISRAAVQTLYADVDGGRIAPTEGVERFRRIADSIRAAITLRVHVLETHATRTHAESLIDALESLRAADGFVHVATPQGTDLSAAWFPSPGATPQANRAILARLAAASAGYASVSQQIRDLAVPEVVANLDRIEADPGVRAFDAAVASALRGHPFVNPGPGASLTAAVGKVFGGYLGRVPLLDGLITTATVAVRHRAQDLAASDHRAFMAWAALALLLAALSLGVALAFGRSIAKPLRDLADYAHAVNDGQLDVHPRDWTKRGPGETRVAFAVFTDLVANLRLLDGKANALANCAFDDPVLQQALPGRLGRSLESSVAVLSGSIVERDRLQTTSRTRRPTTPSRGSPTAPPRSSRSRKPSIAPRAAAKSWPCSSSTSTTSSRSTIATVTRLATRCCARPPAA